MGINNVALGRFEMCAPEPEIMALFPSDFIKDVNEWFEKLEGYNFLITEREKWFMSNIYNMMLSMKKAIRESKVTDHQKAEMDRFVEGLLIGFNKKVYVLENVNNFGYDEKVAEVEQKVSLGERKLIGDFK